MSLPPKSHFILARVSRVGNAATDGWMHNVWMDSMLEIKK